MSHYSTLKGRGRAIAYFPQLGIHLGNPLAGIFLSQLVYWHDKTDCELGVYIRHLKNGIKKLVLLTVTKKLPVNCLKIWVF